MKLILAVLRNILGKSSSPPPVSLENVDLIENITHENIINLSDYLPDQPITPNVEELMKIAFISTDVIVADLLSRNSEPQDIIIKEVSQNTLIFELSTRIDQMQELCESISLK